MVHGCFEGKRTNLGRSLKVDFEDTRSQPRALPFFICVLSESHFFSNLVTGPRVALLLHFLALPSFEA